MVAAEQSNIETVKILFSYNARIDVFEEVTKKKFFCELDFKPFRVISFNSIRMENRFYIWQVNKVLKNLLLLDHQTFYLKDFKILFN